MLSSIKKYVKKQSKHKQQEDETNMTKKKKKMAPNGASQGCCLCLTQPATTSKQRVTTARTSRSEFAKATASSLFPDVEFTNHESLPSLSDSFSSFSRAFPKYEGTEKADRIREEQYRHLFDHVCLDYNGFSLFSHSQMHNSVASTSSSQPPKLQPPFFSVSYKITSQTTSLESAMRKRVMHFLSIDEEDYSMLCTTNRAAAFKILAETYPFRSNRRLLTVYDHESSAVSSMEETGRRGGAEVMSASFSWPGLRIQSAKLKRMIESKTKTKKKKRGLFVFPLQSRITGTRYPYLWMKLAQENGWHVALDACALGPKELDSLGISLIQPDFIVCSFFRVIGENPSGFACLFIKKSSLSILDMSEIERSVGVVSIVDVQRSLQMTDDLSGTFSDIEITRSFSGPLPSSAEQVEGERLERGENEEDTTIQSEDVAEIECIGLDHADSLGLSLINNRLRYIVNWLVVTLMKLRHPHSENENSHSLVRIYGPRVKFERGPAIAFNVFDWKGEKVDPRLVQKLADRCNISLSCGFLQRIWFSEKYEDQKDIVLESRKDEGDPGVAVVNASLGFLTNFEDAYKLWCFVAKFLDADFVEKERWRYMALNQTIIEV